MAAWPAFRKFAGVNGANPNYNRKEKAHANDPAKFSGNKTKFDAWVHSRDPDVTYEKFCNRVATAAYNNQLAYKKRQQKRKPRPYDLKEPKNKNKKPRSNSNPGKSKTSGNTGKPLSEAKKKVY
ncbi:hypothetical protein DL770_008648 [Monosporascus sp. CRB-9-2]|nr:hypothetical protein DL770_008648 [Monosporascus sp. CRB-9-2]